MRVEYGRQENKFRAMRNLILSIVVFCAIVIVFIFGCGWVSARSDREQAANLQKAVWRGVTECYALEGYYPESLDYLSEHYGLSYDKERFVVEYQTRGQNLLPDVTIIEKK